MAHADLTQADHDLLVRIAREGAEKAIGNAIDAVLTYADMIALYTDSGQAYEQVMACLDPLDAAKAKLGKAAW